MFSDQLAGWQLVAVTLIYTSQRAHRDTHHGAHAEWR